MSLPGLGAREVIQIASAFDKDDDSFVIGGQATNLWALFLRDRLPELHAAGPLTSKDIDYFGNQSVARQVADRLNGRLYVPQPGEHTPNTAKVIATLNGQEITIDFLGDVLGIQRRELHKGVTEIAVPGTVDGRTAQINLRVLHPILCLKSRIVSMLHPAIRRTDPVARRQLDASIIIARAYIDDAIATGDRHEAKECFRAIFRNLKSDQYVKRADRDLGVDPLGIIRHFINDDRIDRRYREMQLRQAVAKIERKRAARR